VRKKLKGCEVGKMNSRQKGAAGERELAKKLREYGYDCRRGQQYCGANGDADVVGIPNVHIEVKRVENLQLDKAMDQAVRDAKEGESPMVFHRKNHKPWLVTMKLEDFIVREKVYQKEWEEGETQ
jgi:Holliday junction resolvase